MKAIETKALTKRFGDLTAVDRLDLAVEEGELFALLGVNGAGKSTTIKLLTCLLRPSSGDAFLLGDSILSAPGKVKEKIGVSPQETAVAPNLTVRENLELMAGVYRLGNRRRRAGELIDTMGLGEAAGKKARVLSGGWQRRLSIAMALVTEPRVLFLDEPTLGLDVLARRELWQIVEGLKGRVTTVLTTHYLEEAEALASRVGVMARGRLRAVGTPGELTALAGKDTFEDAFVALAADGMEVR